MLYQESIDRLPQALALCKLGGRWNPFSRLLTCRFSGVPTSPSPVLVFRWLSPAALFLYCLVLCSSKWVEGMRNPASPHPHTLLPGPPPDLTCGTHTSPNNRHPSQALHLPAPPAGSFSGHLCDEMGGGEGGAALRLLLSCRG